VYVTMLCTGRVTKCVRHHAIHTECVYVCTSPCCTQRGLLCVYVTMLYTGRATKCVRHHAVYRESD
jgi:hypothetical protein